jgi:hypothetical protein
MRVYAFEQKFTGDVINLNEKELQCFFKINLERLKKKFNFDFNYEVVDYLFDELDIFEYKINEWGDSKTIECF